MCCHLLDISSVGGTKYEFIIVGRGDDCLSKISCLCQFIYPLHVSVVDLLCKSKSFHFF